MLVKNGARRRGRKEKTKGLKRGGLEEKITADQQPQDLREAQEMEEKETARSYFTIPSSSTLESQRWLCCFRCF
jgi:hypothetical protein